MTMNRDLDDNLELDSVLNTHTSDTRLKVWGGFKNKVQESSFFYFCTRVQKTWGAIGFRRV